MIFLQTPEGPVKAIRHTINSDDWSVDFTVPGNAAPETAIAAFATDVELVVKFFGTEHKIHVHRRNFQIGEWSAKRQVIWRLWFCLVSTFTLSRMVISRYSVLSTVETLW
ncbi:hypothetical protein SNK03_011829 [Fusarium graminearum]